MKTKIIFLFKVILISCLTNTCFAEKVVKDELSLKNYGFAYCLSTSQDQEIKEESAFAEQGYFQMGNYVDNAYKNIVDYMKLKTKNVGVYQMSGKKAILMSCLDIYNSNEYNKLIKNQHKFLSKFTNYDF